MMRDLVDPQLLAWIERFPPMDFARESLAAIRDRVGQLAASAPVPADLEVDVAERRIPGPDGNALGLLVYAPRQASAARPALLYVHAGGFVLGSAGMADAANRSLAAELGCTIVSVDYRLAPETPHPGPVEDCYTALRWIRANAGDLGVDARRIAVSGRSAGGGLAAALALLARDRKEVDVAFLHLVSPMLDDRTCTRTDPHPCTGTFLWTIAHNRFAWRALLGGEPGAPGVSPYAAPARAADLSGLPPTFIAIGALDLFLEESMEYARRLTRARVPTELHVYPGAVHGFDAVPGASIAAAAANHSRDALRRALCSEGQVQDL